MSARITRRRGLAAAGMAALAFSATACGGSSSTSGSGSGSGGSTSADCAAYKQYGTFKGKTVSIFASIVTPEDAYYKDSYKQFEKCTGIKVAFNGDKSFETQVLVRARAGNAPDIALVPQPGLLRQLVATGKAKPAPASVAANVDKYWSKDWKTYGTVDGKFYAAPSGANIKSLVWYSPKEFKDKGYQIPQTLDELTALSDKIAATGKKPWCAGISSGEATGWVITDWMEDMMLRLYGPTEYDKWTNHQIAFNSPEPTAALDEVGHFLKNPKYVNGGYGNVKSIASTTFQDGGLSILQGTCSLHRQASFYANQWPQGTKVAQDGDVYAFYLPGKTADAPKVYDGGGEFNLAFSDRPEVQALQTYLSSPEWANAKASSTPTGGWITANTGLDTTKLVGPIDQLSAKLLQDKSAIFRFDASDSMPAAVGSDSFWKQSTNWITGQSTKDTVDKIEASWPK